MDEQLNYAVGSPEYAERLDRLQKAKARNPEGRPGLGQDMDVMHKRMAVLSETVLSLSEKLRPVLRDEATHGLGPGKAQDREGMSELHRIVLQWADQAESLAAALAQLRDQVDL
jgi:hypothetical protein